MYGTLDRKTYLNAQIKYIAVESAAVYFDLYVRFITDTVFKTFKNKNM